MEDDRTGQARWIKREREMSGGSPLTMVLAGVRLRRSEEASAWEERGGEQRAPSQRGRETGRSGCDANAMENSGKARGFYRKAKPGRSPACRLRDALLDRVDRCRLVRWARVERWRPSVPPRDPLLYTCCQGGLTWPLHCTLLGSAARPCLGPFTPFLFSTSYLSYPHCYGEVIRNLPI